MNSGRRGGPEWLFFGLETQWGPVKTEHPDEPYGERPEHDERRHRGPNQFAQFRDPLAESIAFGFRRENVITPDGMPRRRNT